MTDPVADAVAPGPTVARRCEAAVVDWDGLAVPTAPLRAALDSACSAGLDIVVLACGGDEADRALPLEPAGPGRMQVCRFLAAGVTAPPGAGPHSAVPPVAHATTTAPTGGSVHLTRPLAGKADATRWAFAELWELGITAAEVIVVSDDASAVDGIEGAMTPVASHAAVAVLEDQAERRRRGQPPCPAPADTWSIAVEGVGDDDQERRRASVLTIGDGVIGSIGVPLLRQAGLPAVTRAAGFYEGEGSAEHLSPLPGWNQLDAPLGDGATLTRVLDLRSGVLIQRVAAPAGQHVAAVELSALHAPGTAVLWAQAPRPLLGDATTGVSETEAATPHGGSLGIRVDDAIREHAERDVTVERIAVYARGGLPAAAARSAAARASGVDALHRAHREAWARRWRDADIVISGDDELQRTVRYSLFQLMAAVATEGEAALGARGLSGDGYRGHVFWDSDVFVVPFLAATCPAAARAMLEYRVRRIDAAMAQARALGRRGARFPWESATTGREVTPTSVIGPRGEVVTVRTGEMEEHIVADVAWAACRYADWTADADFSRTSLPRLLVETARYWASRIEEDGDGSAHIRHVIGPDEYHEDVDDNAYTNVMARWNLRTASSRAREQCDDGEVRRWRDLADRLVDGFDPDTAVYEQFDGFSALTPFPLRATYGPGPIAADSAIGFERIHGLQVVKQADVLMLHLMVPDEVAAASLAANLDRYLPMTAHGSSLSPAVHAALLARAGREEEAVALLRLAAGLDIGGTSATTADGLHIATMGGVWLAMVEGFAGIRAQAGGLRVRPRVPAGWGAVTVNLVFRGVRVRVRIDGGDVQVDADGALDVVVDHD